MPSENTIDQLYMKQITMKICSNEFTVYHGQDLPRSVFNELQKTQDALLSFNSFLSPGKNRGLTHFNAESNASGVGLIPVSFVIKIDLVGGVHFEMGDYTKARSFYEPAMGIGRVVLSSNHAKLRVYLFNLERVEFILNFLNSE
ncbi:unnamed protein product [Adineta ricciae]|uniref:Uncharacterized protein n=1 Tax=Adineta ricciae TaxID=249248 RepID=A0A813PGK8_ADIRI|nr:unnamed protein product [Adineta ricciae]